MAYGLCFRLESFDRLPVRVAIAVIQHMVQALVEANVEFLRTHEIPPLYQAGVVYRSDSNGTEMQWWDVPAVWGAGYGDCKALAAWRAAELRAQGVPASIVVTTDDGLLFHVRVQSAYGLEDPSMALGMVTR